MSSLDPRNDSSNVVYHARQSLFFLTFASALILITMFFDDPEELHQAISELNHISKLMTHFRNAPIHDSREIVPLTELLLGGGDKSDSTLTAYRLTIKPSSSSIQASSFYTERSCTLYLDLNTQHFVTNDGSVRYVAVGKEKDEPRTFFTTTTGDDMAQWTHLPYVPTSLKSFIEFWNLLVESGKSATIVSPTPIGGLVYYPSLDSALHQFRKRFATLEVVTTSTEVEVSEAGQGLQVVTGPTSFDEFTQHISSGDSESEEAVFELRRRIHNAKDPFVDFLGKERKPNVVIMAAHCYLDDHSRSDDHPLLVVFSASVKHKDLSWTESWLKHAKIDDKLVDVSERFRKSYPNLFSKSARLEELSFENLEYVLRCNRPKQAVISFVEFT